MKKSKYIFGQPYIDDIEIKAVTRVLKSKWIGFGKESIQFEKDIQQYIDAPYGALVSSCTAALHLALRLHDVQSGDEIITTALTFASTGNAMLYLGAKPVFVDIEKETLNIDPALIEVAITKRTKGIVIVHFGGLPCDLKKINAIAKQHGLFVIEDAAHALGATYAHRPIGKGKNFVCFSFYANKNLTSVDGGYLAVPSNDLAEKAKSLRLHGLSSDAWNRYGDSKKLIFQVQELGYKYNLNDVLSAIGRVQLKRMPKFQKKRLQYAKDYDRILHDVPGITLQPKEDVKSGMRNALHLYTAVIDPEVFVSDRETIVRDLRQHGVFSVVHYYPLHLHVLYQDLFGQTLPKLPVTEAVGAHILSLPLLPQFSAAEAADIANITKKVLLKHAR